MTDQPQASYRVAVAPDGLVLAETAPADSDLRGGRGRACLAYLGSDPASKAQAAAAALAALMAPAEMPGRRRRRP